MRLASLLSVLFLASAMIGTGCSAMNNMFVPHDGVSDGGSEAAPGDTIDDLAPPDDATPPDDTTPPDDVPVDIVIPPEDVPPPSDVAPLPGPLTIRPADLVVPLPSGTSHMITYTVLDSSGANVTPSATLTVDAPALGSFAGNVFTTSSTRGGVTRVRATVGMQSGDTGLEVDRATDSIVLAGAPADAASRFGGSSDPTRAPTFVYPSDQTIVPPNLPSFEVHFMPGAGNNLFELSFVAGTSSVRVYAPCVAAGGGCVITLDALTFSEVAIAARATGTVQITLRGTSMSGGSVGSASPRTLGVTSTPLRGGLYYWAAASGSILRWDFDRPGTRAETYLTGSVFDCVGCHTLSRDGTRIAAGRSIPGPAQTQILDVASRVASSGTFGSNFQTFSPDNTRLLASDGAHLFLLDGATGAAVPGLASGFVGSMPDWSPDGTHAVFSRAASGAPPFGGTPGQSGAADLLVMAYASGSFGAATTLVHSTSEDNYYPSYSPDGRWVLFNRSASDSYNAIDAHLWAIHADGSGGAVDLATANGSGQLGNSWAKWAPYVDSYQGQPLMWFTVASRRDYGLRLQQQSTAADMRIAQIWMAAFIPGRTPDPSAPAFWLPIQDLTVGNHIAQWAQAVRRTRCGVSSACPSGDSCVNGVCLGPPP